MHGQTPQYLVDPVPPLRRHLFGTNIRNELHPMCWRTQRFKNSFYPDAVKNWNNIGPEMRQTDEISTFKSTLKAMIVPEEKSIFKIHSQDLRYLYQLRVGLSPLRAHKFRHSLDIISQIHPVICALVRLEPNPLLIFFFTVPFSMVTEKS